MNTCPACSKAIDPNQLACPHCGISLHPGTAVAGPAAAGGGSGMSIAAIAVTAVVGIVILLACFGAPVFLLFGARAMVRPPAVPPVAAPMPPAAPSAIVASPASENPVQDAVAESSDGAVPVDKP